ncbi:MAG: helix-turn-helix transcriptional regulator [Cyclobacteriaceae bacterium]
MKGNINAEYLNEVRRLIGDWLRQCREGKGLSQKQLADVMDLDKATIAKIENGKWAFNIDMLTRFCVALDVYLFLCPKDSKGTLAEDMRNRWNEHRTDS